MTISLVSSVAKNRRSVIFFFFFAQQMKRSAQFSRLIDNQPTSISFVRQAKQYKWNNYTFSPIVNISRYCWLFFFFFFLPFLFVCYYQLAVGKIPFGTPHGGGVRPESRKSNAGCLAGGKVRDTWAWLISLQMVNTRSNNGQTAAIGRRFAFISSLTKISRRGYYLVSLCYFNCCPGFLRRSVTGEKK